MFLSFSLLFPDKSDRNFRIGFIRYSFCFTQSSFHFQCSLSVNCSFVQDFLPSSLLQLLIYDPIIDWIFCFIIITI